MSKLFSAKKICEMALEKIGALSINDESADPNELSRALHWLDLIMAELAGVERCWWLVPAAVTMPLTASTASYDIQGTVGASSPADGIQFPYKAKLNDGNGNFSEVKIIDRTEYEELTQPEASGTPTHCYIDRAIVPTMKVYPVPGSTMTGYSIDLAVQSFAPDFATDGRKATGLRAAWQAWAIEELASKIGAGPVRRLPRAEIGDLKSDAELSRSRLLAFENREHDDRPPVSKFRSF